MAEAYWHIHHCILMEFTTEPIANRRWYIERAKPAGEVATRLRWLTLVRGKLPSSLCEAREDYDRVRVAYRRAWDDYNRAMKDYNKALGDYEGVQEAVYRTQKAYDIIDKDYERAALVYHKALADHKALLEELHAQEHPGCPWNGETLFPKGD